MDLTEKSDNEHRHPWEMSRKSCLLKMLDASASFVYADIGSGDRFFSSGVRSVCGGKVYAVDNGYTESIAEKDGMVLLNDVSLLENRSVDCLIMMDVLEHVERENDFLATTLAKVKPGGQIIVTVPAMQFLFSSHDVFLKHYRRYHREQLLQLLRSHKIVIERCHYFFTVLFFIRFISLAIKKTGLASKKADVGIGSWRHGAKSIVTRSLLLALNGDFVMNRLLNGIGVWVPGLSLLAICRKAT